MAISSPQLAAFVHPGLAWAALATGLIPILVHLWNRRRYRRVPWAAMQFLLAASRRTARRLWIERMLLLLLRIAVISLFGFAVARPYLRASTFMIADGARIHRVLVLDDSLSTEAVNAQGVSRFERARTAALHLIDSFSERDGVSLVTTSWPAQTVFDDPVYDRRILRERIEAHSVSHRRDDMAVALERVGDILRASQAPAENRLVYLISDLPQNHWGPNTTGIESVDMNALRKVTALLDDRAEHLVIVPVGEKQTKNLAVAELRVETPLIGINLPVRITVGVLNAGHEIAHDVALVVRQDGRDILDHTWPRVESGEIALFQATTVFSQPGTHGLETRILDESDQLAADNARFLSVEVQESTPVLILDGRPGSTLLDSEAGFLATALAPGNSSRIGDQDRSIHTRGVMRVSPVAPRVVSELEFTSIGLDAFSTIVLCNVPSLPEREWSRLGDFVRRGGGLFVTLGDLVDPENYNRFGYADGDALLPCRFDKGGPGTASSGGLGIAEDELKHPIGAGFAGRSTSGLFSARIDRYLPIEPDPRRAETALSYTNGAPALVTAQHGKGRVAMLTTSADLDWTNLPAKGDFVSLMYNVIAYITPQPGAARNLSVGETLEQRLDAASALMPIRVQAPDGAEVSHELLASEESYAVRIGPLKTNGLYKLSIGTQQNYIAANTDVTESYVAGAARETFTRSLEDRFRWLENADAAVVTDKTAGASELALPLLSLVAILLLVETAVAWWSASARGNIAT